MKCFKVLAYLKDNILCRLKVFYASGLVNTQVEFCLERLVFGGLTSNAEVSVNYKTKF